MQHRRLIRCSDLYGFRRALIDLATAGGPLAARRRAIVVPTRASAELLRQAIEAAVLASGRRAVVLPDLLTRDDLVARLHLAVPDAAPMLARIEREVLLARAARSAATRGGQRAGPFELRPGLVAAMLDLYDELRRRQRSVRRFARSLFDQLRVERGTDRGSEGLVHQTCFLGFTFLAYERAVAGSGATDEHQLRKRLLAEQPPLPFDHVVIAVADRPTDPRGLWPADFDLLGRLEGVRTIDVVTTDEMHDAGFRERVERELPGIEEIRREAAERAPAPVLPGTTGKLCLISRDREEELRDVARIIRARRPGPDERGSTAVVFQRPLPYLYLAQQVLADARVPYQAFDALPLAAEPYAALLDLVMAVARTGGTREAMTSLLRSTLVSFAADDAGASITAEHAGALDLVLSERRVTGEADTYVSEVERYFAGRPRRDGVAREHAVNAARTAARIREALLDYRYAGHASRQIAALSGFLRAHELLVTVADAGQSARQADLADRHARARAAVLGILDGLAAAFRRHADAPRLPEDLTAMIRHAVESQTFAPRRGRSGVHLVDATAAPFGEFDHVHLVGLVETDWPERPRRSVFYTSGLLKAVGWPQEVDQMRAQQAAFRDLLRLAARTTTLHAFQLEGDSIVALSPMIEAARDLPAGSGEAAPVAASPTFTDEILRADVDPGDLDADVGAWLALRRARPGLDDPRYSGRVTPLSPAAYRVSEIDRYVTCPFKYFSERVLGLPEEREESSGLTPLERGVLIHDLFERFYRTWCDRGLGTITPATLPEAVALFAGLTHDALSALPEADRALEETRLLGSIVSRGLAERVFELESDSGGTIVERLLEFPVRGEFTFPLLHGLRQKTVDIRGKADRVDVFDDGTIRVVDYKLGRLPDLKRSVQIAVYAHCAQAAIEAETGRRPQIGAAMYLAFGDDRQLEGALGSRNDPVEMAVGARLSDFAAIVERIESGEFGPKPLKPGDCQWCRYALVCRKEYQFEDDEAAESV